MSPSALAQLEDQAPPIPRSVLQNPRRTFELVSDVPVAGAELRDSSELIKARELVQDYPTSSLAHLRLAQTLWFESRPMDAESELLSVSQADRSTPELVLVSAGYLLLAMGRVDAARQTVMRLDSTEARLLLAQCDMVETRFDEAREVASPCDTYWGYVLTGRIALERHDYQGAIRAFRRATALGPASSEIMLSMAIAHRACGSVDHALRAATVACGLAPARVDAAAVAAFARFELGDTEGALRELTRVRQLRPLSIRPPMYVAMIRLATGHPQEALRELRALNNQQDERFWRARASERSLLLMLTTQARVALGQLSLDSARRRYLKAWVDSDFVNEDAGQMALLSYTRLDDAGKIRPFVEAYKSIATVEHAEWAEYCLALLELRYDDAIGHARQWLQMEPSNFAAAANLMELLTDVHHDPQAAVEIGREFRRRVPRGPHMVNTLAYHLIMAGDLRAAERMLREEVPVSPYILATKGLLALYQGNFSEGVALYMDGARLASSSGFRDLGDLIVIRLGYALAAVGQPEMIPKLPRLDTWEEDLRYLLIRELHGFDLRGRAPS